MAETASRTYPISSSYQFPSEIKQFTPGKRNTYHIRVENGDIYIFKTYRPEDEEDDRLEYIPEDELEVYNYSPPPPAAGDIHPHLLWASQNGRHVRLTAGELRIKDLRGVPPKTKRVSS